MPSKKNQKIVNQLLIHYNFLMQIESLISFSNVRIQNLQKTIISNLNWQMNNNEAWLIIGPNGGGKADFLKALAGECQIISNTTNSPVSTNFENSTEIVSLEKAAQLIEEERDLDESEYMDKLDEGRTGRRFLCEVLGGPDSKHRNQPLPPIADRLETLPEVKLCGIEKILDRGLKLMSTGEIRRTLLCRALLSGKKLLILSDPFAGLDAQSRKILLNFFETIVGKQKNPTSTRIILSMERYSEIPETITHVLEFSENKISFSGLKTEYELLLKQRESEKSKTRIQEKETFISQVTELNKLASVFLDEKVDSPEKTLIKMQNVNVGWDGHKVLENFNWEVKNGCHWLVRGPNGSGKTTLLELITGDNHQVFCNDIWLFGNKRGSGETIWDIKKQLGIVSYRLHVEYRMVGGTDLESVLISGFHDSIGLYEQKTDTEISTAKKWLKLAGFEGREMETFNSLSYGEQRSILIVRAAIKKPKVLILDEPCHGLDETSRQRILDLLETIANTGTTTLLHVTHDPTEVLPCEKNILELNPNSKPMYNIISL